MYIIYIHICIKRLSVVINVFIKSGLWFSKFTLLFSSSPDTIAILSSILYFRDFKSSRYSTYNNLLQLKSVHRLNQVVEIKSSFDYGRTYTSKVNKQRATVNGIAKYNFKKNGASINYNVSIGYQPAVSNQIYYSKLKK